MTRSAGAIATLLAPATLISLGMVGAAALMLGISLGDQFPNATTLTFGNYRQVFEDAFVLRAALRTLQLGLTVTLICVVFGYPVSWYLVYGDPRATRFVFLVVLMPLLVSIVVRTLGWTIVLGNEGLLNHALLALGVVSEPLQLMRSFWTVVTGLVHIFLPFMILSITSTLGRIDRHLPEAASLLGARPSQVFRLVVLPLSIQGIATGSVIVFCLASGVYLMPLWLGRGSVSVLATVIEQQVMQALEWPTGAATSMVLTAGSLGIVAAYGLVIRRYARR